MVLECLKALLFGMVEGITEWLPISSTGHLILLEDRMPFAFSDDEAFLAEFFEMFEVTIQLGAVLAVVFLFGREIFPFSRRNGKAENTAVWRRWKNIVAGCVPAGIVGVFGDRLLKAITGKDLQDWLYRPWVVAIALIAYGIVFLVLNQTRRDAVVTSVDGITLSESLKVGTFQVLSLIPGTSRSGSSILGGVLSGFSTSTAAKFSFFLAIPVMVGASGIKILGFASYVFQSQATVPFFSWILLGIGCITSFGVSVVSVRFLLEFVKKHGFDGFGIYRILLGLLVLLLRKGG